MKRKIFFILQLCLLEKKAVQGDFILKFILKVNIIYYL
jgi:hypothetical protein